MKIDSKALEYFDKKIPEIAQLFTKMSLSNFQEVKTGFPMPLIEDEISAADIVGDIKISLIDEFGEEQFRYFLDEKKQAFGVSGQSLVQFNQFAEQIEKACKFQVSREYISDLILDYCEKKQKALLDGPFSKLLETEITNAIQEYEIISPISSLSVEKAVQIGDVTIVPLHQAEIESWFSRDSTNLDQAQSKTREIMIQEVRKEHQGAAAAKVISIGEKIAAERIARERIEKALSILRLYSPANFHPKLTSFTTVWGISKIPEFKSFVRTKGAGLQIRGGMVQSMPVSWLITNQMLAQMDKDGLSRIATIYQKQKQSSFEKSLLETIWLYTQSSLKMNVYEKLLYMLAGLENLLIKNTSEPLQQNIAERLAFLVAPDLQRRQAVIENVKKVYSIRSSFFHHGKATEDNETLIAFMHHMWHMLMNLIAQSDKFNSKDDIFAFVDRLKLS